MRKIFWVLTLAATVIGGVYFAYSVVTNGGSFSSPGGWQQELLGIARGLGTVIIPYIFTRCLEGLRHADVMRVRIVGNERPRERTVSVPEPRASESHVEEPVSERHAEEES